MAMRGAADPQFTSSVITGHPSQILESLHRSVAQYIRAGSNVTKFYIGIASGDDAIRAIRRRYDEYKFDEGISEVIALYSSSSEDYTRAVETDLEQFFRQHQRNINRVGGGGGRTSSGPQYFVYIALRRWG
eukprot:TRINITY_DN5617_c0_g1_i1.p1 TRINITY_DN5617_c0_g1~~TRINITY_DN5617_c0_g1_i1.p1  ORF type:complete len:131 (-),score=25.39 TRINITY_DN5617_c0_g1_i1:34-426(-)